MIRRLRAVPPPAPATDAFAAVATILRRSPTGEGTELLFIERAERPGDPWSGHIAFPGGKREGDESLLHTAVRETGEEVGLRLSVEGCLAQLGTVAASVSGSRVAQFVFALEDDLAAPTTSAEVSATLWVPLAQLARFEGKGTIRYARDGHVLNLPSLRIGPYELWGLTYRMVLQLLEALGVAT